MRGGLQLIAHKQDSTTRPIERAGVPEELTLRIRIDASLQVIARVGEHVLLGQPLARSDAASVHASASGQLTAIDRADGNCTFIIKNDGADTRDLALVPIDYRQLPADKWRECIAHAGIVGLGGACFSAATKLAAAAQHSTPLLIVNGAECEPFITCDDMLMREHADDVILGTQAILHAISGTRAIIAVESNKSQAMAAVAAAVKLAGDTRIEARVVPTFYPTGGELQLIMALTAKEVPSGGVPPDIGMLCQNVGTAAAIARLIKTGEPLIRRVVTVTGGGVQQPRNLLARFGTPIANLIRDCGGYTDAVERLIMGGSMMGVALASDEIEVSAATNCIVAAVAHDLKPRGMEMPCIRCGECAYTCPVGLQPQQLLRYARLQDRPALTELGLSDCIECGCCDYVCPSQIPLTATFISAKQ